MGKDILKMLIILGCVLAILAGLGYLMMREVKEVVSDVTASAEKAAKGQAIKEGLDEVQDLVGGLMNR